jgi:hypothetical protein
LLKSFCKSGAQSQCSSYSMLRTREMIGSSFFLSFLGWGETGSTWYTCLPLTGLLYQPRTIDNECGAVGWMRTGRGNRSTRRKRAPVPLCPPLISHDPTWAWTWAATVGSQWLTAWAMARPLSVVNELITCVPFMTYISCLLA